MVTILMRRTVLLGLCIAALALAQAPPRKAAPKKAVAPAKAAAAQSLPGLPIIQKSALDKPTFEAYLRHLMAWFPPIEVKIGDARPAATLPGFFEVTARGTLGQASQEETFLVSKDGKQIVRGTVYDIDSNPFKPELDKLKTEFQPSMGTPGATVVLVVFTDFQCPFCKDEAKMLRQNLLQAYPKQVRLYFKDYPLQQIHDWAKPASIAGRCIFRQDAGSFWTYHDWVYENQATITKDNFQGKVLAWAKDKEIDILQLTRCLETRATESDVDKNIADARALGVNSTPTLFVNGRRLVGQVSWEQLKQLIDNEIEYQKIARNAGEDCGCDTKLSVPGTGGASSIALSPAGQ
ncbi:MAG TPA: thioredoxin domain-containing protein [Bryobacteraceae bacterium]|nr:thioredoxin domain-containing protein [Bryobacteraceae bacterium]